MNKLTACQTAKFYRISTYQRLRQNPSVQLSWSRRCFSDDGADNNDDKKRAKEKLNSLLQELHVAGAQKVESTIGSKLAKPKPMKPVSRTKEGKFRSEIPKTDDLDESVVRATREVSKLSSNKTSTESQLLMKLKQVAKESKEAKRENEVSGESVESLFSGLRIDKPLGKHKQKTVETLKSGQDLSMEQMAFLQKRAKLRRDKSAEKLSETSVDLHSGIPLGIFDGPMTDSTDKDLITTWRACNRRELEILSRPPPRNALEEMIVQTKEGKLWQFPVDNEQGELYYEAVSVGHQCACAAVYPVYLHNTTCFVIASFQQQHFNIAGLDYSDDPFYNHVFLDHNLEGWCPRSGPVRNFMETICLGLSQNPYMSSEKKVDTIMWFKDYFERPENNEILVHSGCWEEDSSEQVTN